MAIVNVTLGLSVQLIDMGFSNAILREKYLSNEKLSSFYWINVLMGIFMALLLWISAPLISAQFPKLNPSYLITLLRGITPVFLFSGFAIQYQSLLQRQLRFKILSIIEILSFIVGFSTSLIFALNGYGAVSLVTGAVIKSVCSTLLLISAGIKQHTPRFCFVWGEVRPVARFTFFQSIEKVVAYFAVNIDTIIITRILAPEHSGVYEVIKRLLIQPWFFINPIVTKVIYPVMAQVHHDLPRLKNIVCRGVQLVSTINIPVYMSCAIGADLIVPILFGSKYAINGVLPFRFLSLSFMIRAVINPFGHVILAKGMADLAFKLQLFALAGSFAAISIGAYFDMLGTLTAILIFNIVIAVITYFYVAKPLVGANIKELLQFFIPELIIGVFAFGLSYQVKHFAILHAHSFFLFIAFGCAIYLAILILVRKNLLTELRMIIK